MGAAVLGGWEPAIEGLGWTSLGRVCMLCGIIKGPMTQGKRVRNAHAVSPASLRSRALLSAAAPHDWARALSCLAGKVGFQG